MRGCRPLTDSEILDIKGRLRHTARDFALFVLGIRTGFRITELLSIKVSDVVQYGRINNSITVQRRSMKGQRAGRTVALHNEAIEAIRALIEADRLSGDDYLFQSQRLGNVPLSRSQAWRVLKDAYNSAELTGKVACHSMRKSFAGKVYAACDKDISMTQRALGHANLSSTSSYLDADGSKVDALIRSID